MAKVIKVPDEVVDVEPMNGTDFSLEELRSFVGGYIEVLDLYDDEMMVVNEEGKLKGLPINEMATWYLLDNSRYSDVIVGNVLICNTNQIK